MYKKILIAIDDSTVSEGALHHAIQLAQEQHAELHVAHVTDIVGITWAAVELLEAYKDEGQALLNHALDLASKAGLKAASSLLETGVVAPRAAEVLAEHARLLSVDLVVLGSHGRRGMSHLFLGSVAEGAARLCSMPVLIVHGPLKS
jgi:nucleotide-binding universal stress UspA family protein